MERERVVAIDVDGDGGPGSGYVIAPRLVLASAHVVPEPGMRVSVFRPGRGQVWRARVVWRGTPGGRDDAALVHVDDPAWTPMAEGEVRWGRLATTTPDTPCETWGRADLVQQPGRPVDMVHPSGTLNPGDREAGNRYVMHLAQYPPQADGDAGSPWGGLSGAALFCGRLLTGVIAADPARRAHAALEAVPAYVLLHDAAFRTALAEHGGPAHSVLEPVEWQDLAEAADPTGGALVRSPAALLRARRQTVPFRGRAAQLEQLQSWSSQPRFGALLLHGSGGQGKTRLAQHLANSLTSRRWSVLWLRPDTAVESVDVLAQATVPLLVIVDYAETRTPQLTALLEAAARHTGTTPWKLLLIARTAGDWWRQLQAHTALAEELLDGAPTIDLPPLEPDPGHSRTDAYNEAVQAYASHLPDVNGLEHHDWPAIATRLTHHTATVLDRDHPAHAADQSPQATALTLHMSALANLLDTATKQDQDPSAGSTEAKGDSTVEDRLLKHEDRYWSISSSHLRTTLTQATLTDALAAVFLTGADTAAEADDLLVRLPALKDQSRDRRDAVRDWITTLYPPTTPGRPWDTLQPDRLAERFIGRRLLTHPDLAHQIIPGSSQSQATQILTVYTRAAAHPVFHHQLDTHLTTLCIQHADTLIPPAIEVATQTEEPQPLLDALHAITTRDTELTSLKHWANQLPKASRNLAPWAAHLTQLITALQRERAHQDPHQRPVLAMSLNSLSNRLAALGRRDEALEAITEAVQIRRELAHTHPDAHRPDLAGSLSNLSNRLAALGRREEALEAVTEAVQIWRELAHTYPDTHRPNLAMSLNNLSSRLGAVGRRDEALEAITEAVQIRRELAHTHPDTHRPNLAGSLNNLSNQLGAVGRRDEALEAITEAVQIRRELAHTHPDAHRPDLAESLNSLSNRLAALGRRHEALEAITEAVQIWRELAHTHPDTYRPALATSLNSLSNRLAALGRRDEALETITEAADLRRELAHTHPDAHRPALATSLHNLSNRLAALGRRDEALETITEAADLRRELAHTHP
ncbi:tetratricopeptide repeat protein, partial [Streptomyces canus]|uniref:tetratricopeptide repeat protein n=1 Tax=Streptomyces canus TaxID=58343 RepID=UPI0033D85352